MATAANETTTGTTQSAVVRTEKKPAAIRLLDSEAARERILPMLAGGASYERVMTEVYLATQKNRDILKCEPASIIQAVARAVGTGGHIGSDVHLIPFGKELTVVEDYKFLREIIIRTGGARSVTDGVVYANEEFMHVGGTAPLLRHVPILDPASRGPLVGAYAVAHLGIRTPPVFVVMAAAEIDRIRQRYSRSWKQGPLDEIPWYCRKTVLRQIAKALPKNPRLAAALARLGILPGAEERELDEVPLAEIGSISAGRLAADDDAPARPAARPVAPVLTVRESHADPALVQHYAEQPDAYAEDTETGELGLDDARPATRRDAITEGH